MYVDNYIHITHLPHVIEYFKQTGWTIQQTKSASEVFRAARRDHYKPVILFHKSDTDFLLVNSRDLKIFTKFMMWYHMKGEIDMKNAANTREIDIQEALAKIDILEASIAQIKAQLMGQSIPDASVHTDGLQEYTSRVLNDIGMPHHVKGYRYARFALMLVVKDRSLLEAMTKALYPGVAKEFDTTPSRVERAIRHAIEVTWDRGDLDTLQRYFGFTVRSDKGRPTNSEFFSLLADYIIARGGRYDMD